MRIRTVKPEWLDDEKIVSSGSDARVLSVALILCADDYGNGRAHPLLMKSRIFPFETQEVFDNALQRLIDIEFIHLYQKDDQHYYHINNWEKHQRVDRPGKPHVPKPEDIRNEKPKRNKKVAYFVRGVTTGLIKIGESIDPVNRLTELAKGSSETLELLAVGGKEREYHKQFKNDHVHGEWFKHSRAIDAKILELNNSGKPIASAGYNKKNLETTIHAKIPVENTNDRAIPEIPIVGSKDLRTYGPMDQFNSHDSPSVEPSLSSQIKSLESRYNTDIIAECRKACALSRRNGKMADSVWLKVLEKLSSYPIENVEASIRKFVERYADGEKDERYLLGILRNKKSNGVDDHLKDLKAKYDKAEKELFVAEQCRASSEEIARKKRALQAAHEAYHSYKGLKDD